jgi:hypothetical protein
MNPKAILDPEAWAKETFGPCYLKDLRRTGRAVKVAARMANDASASLPAQMQTWKETIALYRLLDEEDVTFEALMQPHFQQTRERVEKRMVVLLVQDTTDLDFTHRQKMDGLGQIGNKQGRGLFLQTVLAVVPQTRDVLGCAMQEPFVRTPIPEGETRSQRHQPAGARDGCLDAPGQPVGSVSWGDYRRPCGRPRSRSVPVLSGMPGKPNGVSGAGV